MLNLSERTIRDTIHRRVAYSCAIAAMLVAILNFTVGLIVQKRPLGDILTHPTVLMLAAVSALFLLSALKDWVAFRLFHVAIFLGYPIGFALLEDSNPYSTTPLIWGIYGMILSIQYGFFRKKFWVKILIYLSLVFVVKIYTAFSVDFFAYHTAFGAFILMILFVYLFWIVFAEEIRQYADENYQLKIERDKNKIFVDFGKNIAGVIHNIKSVMMSIEGYNDIMRITHKSEWDNMLDLQKRSNKRMLEMINNFMEAVRSYQREEEQHVSLNRLVMGSVEVLKGNAELKGKLKIHMDLREPDAIHAAPMIIMQTIDNLVTNSAHAMKNTGHFDLEIKTFPEQGYTVLAVEDQGHGIDFCHDCILKDCVKCKNFEIGRSRKKDGTGIGVVFVQQTMRELQGKMKIDSVLGTGTTVRLFFPSAASENRGKSQDAVRTYG
ncbi:MAG: hypothetical protein CMN78_03895 [Spirochaetales bacterium]|nr:hypothetical protein [Spirochaetales bacterium]